MSPLLIAFSALGHFGVPLALGVWLRSTRAQTRVEWCVVLFALLAYVSVLVPAGAAWNMFGLTSRLALILVLAVLLPGGFTRARALPNFERPRGRTLAVYVTAGLLFLLSLPAFPYIWTRHHYEGAPVSLDFPLHDGRFIVANGGGNEMVNPHAAVPAQRYALDVEKLGPLGARASALSSADVRRYAIYDAPVHAPCDGTVLFTRADLADLAPPATDAEHPAGNHVVLRCEPGEPVSVLLAHLETGSVEANVTPGTRVTCGQLVARAGNTGNTSEPHLHIQAIRGEAPSVEAFMTGEAVPMLFAGRFPARNDVITRNDARPE